MIFFIDPYFGPYVTEKTKREREREREKERERQRERKSERDVQKKSEIEKKKRMRINTDIHGHTHKLTRQHRPQTLKNRCTTSNTNKHFLRKYITQRNNTISMLIR